MKCYILTVSSTAAFRIVLNSSNRRLGSSSALLMETDGVCLHISPDRHSTREKTVHREKKIVPFHGTRTSGERGLVSVVAQNFKTGAVKIAPIKLATSRQLPPISEKVFRRQSYPFQSRARHFTMSKNAKQSRNRRRLPPLSSITQSSPGAVQPSRIPSPVTKVGGNVTYPTSSRYHRNCRSTYRRESPGPGCYLDEILKTRSNSLDTQRRSSKFSGSSNLLSNNATKMMRSCSHDNLSSKGLNPEKVTNFLRENIDFLEEYVINNVGLELLERWMIRGVQKSRNRSQSVEVNGRTERKTSLSRWKFCVHADKRKMLQDLTTSLYTSPNMMHVLSELVATIASAVNVECWNLYLFDRGTQELHGFTKEDNRPNSEGTVRKISIHAENNITAFVARNSEPVRIAIGEPDPRFPDGAMVYPDSAAFILAHPIQQPDGELTGVLELYRNSEEGPFHEEDEEIINSYLVWGGIALHYAEMYTNMARQRKLNNFLLAVVRSIFQDMISMDSVIVKIMTFAQKLVNADRASLFLVDGRTKELYARIFDVSGDQESKSTVSVSETSKEIRFPVGKGIAGHVALTGQSLNIPDAYDDDRFNRTVDQQTGYRTRNLLCMPIFIRNNVIGVVQMVNKESGPFSKADEEAFATFATYCGLALHHAKLYDKIRRSEQKYKVALEVLSYHSTCTETEVNEIKHSPPLPSAQSLAEFNFSPFSLDSEQKVSAAIYMFIDLFGLNKFDQDCLIRFTLTVRKNYRRVPYHNWEHGFSVANSMYAIIKSSPEVFTPTEKLALFVACLCHDLDHRGKNNQFLVKSASPLAAMYTTSTLEHHHFNQTVSILQQEGHNIFKNLTSDEYKKVLRNIKHCILATDLALFFPNQIKLRRILDENGFDWDSNEHRLLLEAIAMTACDLCASTKPWEEQRKTVKVIFEEFYEQGDAERMQGREPVPMMDRTKPQEQPASQVGFLTSICKPCYELLAAAIPESRPMLNGCLRNLGQWQSLVEELKVSDESQPKSIQSVGENVKELEEKS